MLPIYKENNSHTNVQMHKKAIQKNSMILLCRMDEKKAINFGILFHFDSKIEFTLKSFDFPLNFTDGM